MLGSAVRFRIALLASAESSVAVAAAAGVSAAGTMDLLAQPRHRGWVRVWTSGRADDRRGPSSIVDLAHDSPTTDASTERYPPPTLREERGLRVALLGAPNAGKSTLTNALAGRFVSAVSRKTNTTTSQTECMATFGNTQVVLYDTPGISSRAYIDHHRGPRQRVASAFATAALCDVALLVVDAPRQLRRADPRVAALAAAFGRHEEFAQYASQPPACALVLTKVDALNGAEEWRSLMRTAADLVRAAAADNESGPASGFEDVFFVTSRGRPLTMAEVLEAAPPTPGGSPEQRLGLEGTRSESRGRRGLARLAAFLIHRAPLRPWQADPWLAQEPEAMGEVAVEAVREACMDCYNEEVPYGLLYVLSAVRRHRIGNAGDAGEAGEAGVGEGLGRQGLSFDITITHAGGAGGGAKASSLRGILVGRKGERIKAVRHRAEAKLAKIFGAPVAVNIKVSESARAPHTLLCCIRKGNAVLTLCDSRAADRRRWREQGAPAEGPRHAARGRRLDRAQRRVILRGDAAQPPLFSKCLCPPSWPPKRPRGSPG